MRPIPPIGLLVPFLTLGCGTFANSTVINDSPRPMYARPPRSVAVFSSGPPTRPHVDVAVITVEQTHDLNEQGMDIIIASMREKAAQMGCDAVVLGSRSERDAASTLFNSGATTQLGTCIVYDEREPPPGELPRPAATPTSPQ